MEMSCAAGSAIPMRGRTGDPSAACWELDAHSGATTHSLMWVQRLGKHRAEPCEKGVLKGQTAPFLGITSSPGSPQGHGEGQCWSCKWPWFSWACVSAGPQMGSSNLPPKKSRLRNPSNCSFPSLSTRKEVRHPEAASLGMQREQDPSSWLHLLHRHQQAAFSANSGDGSSE